MKVIAAIKHLRSTPDPENGRGSLVVGLQATAMCKRF